MKKIYQKPMAYAESFIMVEHVASGCVVDKDHGVYAGYLDNRSCAFVDSNIVIFPDTTVCKGMDLGLFDNVTDFLDPEQNTLECYNTFSGNGTPFVS